MIMSRLQITQQVLAAASNWQVGSPSACEATPGTRWPHSVELRLTANTASMAVVSSEPFHVLALWRHRHAVPESSQGRASSSPRHPCPSRKENKASISLRLLSLNWTLCVRKKRLRGSFLGGPFPADVFECRRQRAPSGDSPERLG